MFFTIAPVETQLLLRFLIGAVLIIFGLGIFLWGADLAIEPIGHLLGEYIGKKASIVLIFIMGFFLGFIITIAEPDLLIFADQASMAMGQVISGFFIVTVVSLGVGLLVGFGFVRILTGLPLHWFFAVTYGLIFLFFGFIPEEFQALGFDASGATTGAMTTPFLLALCLGLSSLKGSTDGEKDSFGLVGIASAGPVIAIMILSLFTKNSSEAAGEVFHIQEGILYPFFGQAKVSLKESFMALLPILLVYLYFQWKVFQLERKKRRRISLGLLYTFIGLIIFLTGVNGGFMDLARMMGRQLGAHPNRIWLPLVGCVLGMVVVLAEPAVYVLSNQVEDVTGGSINKKMIRTCLSIGVAIAVGLSMLRIQIPGLRLWMYLVPGFIIAIIISFQVPEIFVGIAFDSGGVASGPMTATFILALAQGAAEVIPTANVLTDGFGVIAAVAMMPVFSIMILGLIYKMELERRKK